MRQRNDTPWPVTVPQIPAEVQPGETIDWPDPITGLTPVDPPQETAPPEESEPADPATLPQPSTPPPGTSSPTRATAAARKKGAVAEAPTSGAAADANVKE
ncbi:hypothetical protein [Amycolatopsis kentuckyensis]|uniref:hypothetical protein n=1 Tax=Amycolatopsis kentuckyensis TaxID=218823 RepID=UPI00356232BD